MTRWQGWLVSLSAALLAIMLAGPPLWSAVSATIQHNEDTVAVSGALGTAMLCVRNDGTAALTGSNNFYANCITDANNRMFVRPAWLTSIGGSIEDTTNVALRVSPVTVVTTQGKTMGSREWTFTAAQSGATALVDPGSGAKIRVNHAQFACSKATTPNVSVRVVIATAVPGTSSTTGAAGVILSHPGLEPGRDIQTTPTGVVEGANGDDLRIEMSVATGGSCSLVVAYETL